VKLQLGDNALDGIRFLFLGGGVLLALRLLYVGLDMWLAPSADLELATVIKSFQNGYLLVDRTTLVVGGLGTMERVAVAILLTVLSAAVIALVALGVSIITRSPKTVAVVRGLRFGLATAGAWWLFAALAWPPHTVRLEESELVRTVRPALLDALSLPWPGESTHVPNGAISAFEHRSYPTEEATCGRVEKVEAVAGEKRMEIARIVLEGKDCEQERKSAEQRLVRLAALLGAGIQ